MRTTITLDDELLEEARSTSGITETGPLLKAALQALIYRETSLQLARLGGSQPNLEDIPRRRPETSSEISPGISETSQSEPQAVAS